MFGSPGGCRSMVKAKCIGLKFMPVALSSHFAALYIHMMFSYDVFI